MVRRDSRFYKPPPQVDIEKMRMNMIKEQKAFALIKEILSEYIMNCVLCAKAEFWLSCWTW